MTNDKYRAHIENGLKWLEFDGLRQSLVAGNDDEFTAKAQILPDYADAHGTTPDAIGDVSIDSLREWVNVKQREARTETLREFGENLEDIVAGMPDEKLSELVYEVIPSVLGVPAGSDARGEQYNAAVKKHVSYLAKVAAVNRYKKGEELEGEERKLRAMAANGRAAEAVREQEEKGNGDDRLLMQLAANEARQSAYTLAGREELLAYAEAGLEAEKAELEGTFGSGYSAVAYARDLIKTYAEKDPEKTAKAIVQLDQSRT